MQTCRKMILKIKASKKLFSLLVLSFLGLIGCTPQDSSAPIDTIHNFGDVSSVDKNMNPPVASLPVEEPEPTLNSDENKDKVSQLVVHRRWTYSPADKPTDQAAPPPKFEYAPAPVTKTAVHSLVNGELLSDDAGVLSIQTKPGEKVHSVVPGSVIYTGPSVQGGGQMVIVKSSEGVLFAYSHLQSIAPAEGRVVSKGDVLGITSNDPLVFQVRQAGGVLDAKKYINS